MRAFIVLTAALPAALLVALTSGPMPADAQDSPERSDAEQLDSVTVVAPRITRQRQQGGRMQVSAAEQTAQVDYNDLDLSRTVDMFTLEERVKSAADEVCKELADLYPEGEPSTEVCVRRATDDAMAQVRHVTRTRVGMR